LDKSVITRVVTVAGGRFAPGHLGELTQQVPFEMVDAVLEQTCRVQRRVRDLPSRVVVYLLLAGCLFAECCRSARTAAWSSLGGHGRDHRATKRPRPSLEGVPPVAIVAIDLHVRVSGGDRGYRWSPWLMTLMARRS
jgi:hypothetical protein